MGNVIYHMINCVCMIAYMYVLAYIVAVFLHRPTVINCRCKRCVTSCFSMEIIILKAIFELVENNLDLIAFKLL